MVASGANELSVLAFHVILFLFLTIVRDMVHLENDLGSRVTPLGLNETPGSLCLFRERNTPPSHCGLDRSSPGKRMCASREAVFFFFLYVWPETDRRVIL